LAERHQLRTTFDAAFETAVSPPLDAPAADWAAASRRSADQLRDAADRFETIRPPTAIADLHDRLIAGVRRFADDLDLVADLMEAEDIEEMNRLGQSLTGSPDSSVNQIIATLEAMQAAGY
jgi:hypothetical protein